MICHQPDIEVSFSSFDNHIQVFDKYCKGHSFHTLQEPVTFFFLIKVKLESLNLMSRLILVYCTAANMYNKQIKGRWVKWSSTDFLNQGSEPPPPPPPTSLCGLNNACVHSYDSYDLATDSWGLSAVLDIF